MYHIDVSTRLRQGDVLEDYYYEYIDDKRITTVNFPYTVIVSQDCDLEQDFLARQEEPVSDHDAFIDTVLVCPAFEAEAFRTGKHLSALNREMTPKGKEKSTTWNYIKSNRDPRYHFLDADEGAKLPNLVIDFKRYYTVSRVSLYRDYQQYFKASVKDLPRTLLSQRFAYYLSRVALEGRGSIA